MGQRSSDRHLDGALVTQLIAEQFPELSARPVEWFDEGWDNEVFIVGDDLVFRFPKRAECVPWFVREIEIMRVIGEAPDLPVPRFVHLGRPSDTFPYPFVGCQRVSGVAADEAEPSTHEPLARDLGRALAHIHRIDPDRIPSPPGDDRPQPWSEHRSELVDAAGVVRPRLEPDLLACAEPYLRGSHPEPRDEGPRCFIHHDVCPDHVMVDPHTGRLTGIIDFADAMVANPIGDFVGLIPLGRPFIDAVITHYSLPLADDVQDQLTWLSRVLTLRWLAAAAVDDPADVPKHLAWVREAFGR